MPRLVFFLLTLSLLAAAAQTSTGSAIVEVALASEPPVGNSTTDSGWAIDPDGSTSSSEERPDSGWAIDPNG